MKKNKIIIFFVNFFFFKFLTTISNFKKTLFYLDLVSSFEKTHVLLLKIYWGRSYQKRSFFDVFEHELIHLIQKSAKKSGNFMGVSLTKKCVFLIPQNLVKFTKKNKILQNFFFSKVLHKCQISKKHHFTLIWFDL